jgi:tripartite-type tricarboxylate transporter receptor subunit TctC
MLTRRALTIGSGASFFAFSGSCAAAQAFPARPIKIIVPSGPGGPNDIVARLAVDILSKLGQPVIVENRPGAGGALGAREAAKASPDGHTLLAASTATLAVLPFTAPDAGYDAVTAFAPVAKFWDSYQIIVVPPTLSAKTLPEFIASARAHAGKLNYAHAGNGGLPHLAVELFKVRAAINIVGVAYRSDAETITAVMSETVQLAIPNIVVALPLIREGKLRALGITSPQRTPLAADIPTVIEGGVADYDVIPFFGLVAPAGTPQPVITRLNEVVNAGLASAEAQSTLSRLGAVHKPGTAQDFAQFLVSARQKWAAAASAAGFAGR